MLEITIPAGEDFDSKRKQFVSWKEAHLTLEHSLLSIAQWEQKYHKPFLSTEKTPIETLDYIKCMTVNKGVDPDVYKHLTKQDIQRITEYINDPMTATWFAEEKPKEGEAKKSRVLTNEVIYADMVAAQIPFECQKWHINRLLTLLRVYAENNKEQPKTNQKDLMAQRRAQNMARRAKAKSKG